MSFCATEKWFFILLVSVMHRLLCNKNQIDQIDMTISRGQYFSPLILDESWSIWYQNDPEGAEILKM